MTIQPAPLTTGHSIAGSLWALRERLRVWREARQQRIAEQRLLQSLDRELLEDIGAAPPADLPVLPNHIGRTEVGPILAVYVPYWGRSAINDARERRG